MWPSTCPPKGLLDRRRRCLRLGHDLIGDHYQSVIQISKAHQSLEVFVQLLLQICQGSVAHVLSPESEP